MLHLPVTCGQCKSKTAVIPPSHNTICAVVQIRGFILPALRGCTSSIRFKIFMDRISAWDGNALPSLYWVTTLCMARHMPPRLGISPVCDITHHPRHAHHRKKMNSSQDEVAICTKLSRKRVCTPGTLAAVDGRRLTPPCALIHDNLKSVQR